MSLPTIPGYDVTELVGRGGMGRVYRATDRRLGRTVAVKVLLDAEDTELVVRFESEAKAVASLSHPNIARLFEFARTDSGQPYCVMEFVGGGTLADALDGKPLRAKLAAEILVTLARAIQAAHVEGILHRDLKPANILIADSSSRNRSADRQSTQHVGNAFSTDVSHRTVSANTPASSASATDVSPALLRIADFGLARRIEADSHVTRTGQIIGTPAYMAPEQASGMVMRPGPGVDIYSLGAILFEMLTGRLPFLGADSVETIMLLLTEDPPAPRTLQPSIPPDLETICLKCLEKKPSRRYLTAADLADELTRFLEDRPILAKPVSRLEHLMKWARRNPWKAIAISLFTASGLAAMIGVAALQAAYRSTSTANASLMTANQKLSRANAEIRDARDLTKDSLDQIVNRVRDRLYEVPQATQLMMDTSRDSVELHRRLHELDPDDLELSRSYVASLYSHVLLEWLHGSREQSTATYRELQSAFNELMPQHPGDRMLKVTRIKIMLDKTSYSDEEQDAESLHRDQLEVTQGIEELLHEHPEAPDVLRLASTVIQQQLNAAANAGDAAGYVAAARERVEFSRRYLQAESDEELKSQASVWLSQSQRVLAQGLVIVNDLAAAEAVLKEALTQLMASAREIEDRTFRHEKAQLLAETASIHSRLDNSVKANSEYADALALLLQLVQDFPDDLIYRSQVAGTLIRTAALSHAQGNSDHALVQLATAETHVQEILKLAPDHAEALTLSEAIPRFRAEILSAVSQPQNTPMNPPMPDLRE